MVLVYERLGDCRMFKIEGISDATVLKLAAQIIEKSQTPKGYKVKTKDGEKKLTTEEVVKFMRNLSKEIDDGRYGVIRRCDTCGNFSRSGRVGKRGWCHPKEHSMFRSKTDYCSGWIPMTPEQIQIKERVNEHHRLSQAKRT